MKRRLLAVLLAVAMLATSFVALPVFAANADLSMANGARTYYGFDQTYTGTVTIDFDLNIGSGSRLNMYLEGSGQNGWEAGDHPWLQFTGEGALYLQDAIKVGNITHGQDNHLQVVVDLAAKSFTVSINNGTPVAATYGGTMTEIAGFDYRMQNTEGTIKNIVVTTAAAEPDAPSYSENAKQLAAGGDSQFNLDKAYTGITKIKFDLTVANMGTNNVRIWFPAFDGGRDDSQVFFAVNPEGKIYAKHASGEQQVGKLTFGTPASFEIVYDVPNKSYTISVDGAAASGPFTVASAQANVGAIAYKNADKDIVIDNLAVSEVVGAATIPDMLLSIGGQEQVFLPTPFTGDVKVSFNMIAIDDSTGRSNAFIYITNSSASESQSINFQAQGVKLWAQAAESAGRATSGVSTPVEIYYNTEATTYAVYVNGVKTGDFSVGSALGDIACFWVKNTSATTAAFELTDIKVENATEPAPDEGGDEEEGPYEYDNTKFDLPKTDEEGVEYPELNSVADIKKSDIPLGGNFKGTGEDLINIEFDLDLPEGFTGGTIGYGSAQFQDAISHWSDMVLMIQFNNLAEYPDDSFNVRNGNAYVYTGRTWSVGTSHFKVTVDTKLKKYNVYYTAPGTEEEVLIAENFDYRGDTASVTDSIGLMTFQGNEGEQAVIRNHKIYGVGYSYVAPKEAKVVEEDRTESTVLTVGPSGKYPTLARALANAIPGDTIEIDAAGDYLGMNSNASIAVDNLTIRGVNGTPVFGYVDRSCAVPVTASKGIWVVSSKNLTVENIKFQNAHDAHEQHGNNYCGIRLEPVVDSTVIIKNCYFTGCDNGMLVGAASGMTVKMINSEFCDNGFGQMKDGNWSTQEHGMYMGIIENFYFEHSISRQIKAQGHLVKTRAKNNYILYSYIAEESTNGSHTSNSNIDIPEGGKLYVIGSVLHQGQEQSGLGNPRMISYAAEGANNADTLVVFANNTIVNEHVVSEAGRAVIFLHENNGKTYSNNNVYFVNNVYQGYRMNGEVPVVATAGSGMADKTADFFTAANGNHIYDLSKAGDAAYAAANDPKFVDAANYDFRLQENSPLIDKGVEAVNVDAVELTPAYELNMSVVAQVSEAFKGDIVVTRSIVGDAIDIGAFEFGNVGSAPVDPEDPEDPEVPEVPFDNKVSASIEGVEEVEYPEDVEFDVVLSKVVDLNVLALGFEYDPSVLTFKEIVLKQGLEEVVPLGVDEENGVISVVYGVKNDSITVDDDAVWATLVFESVEPDDEVSATVEMTHFAASGLIDDGNDAVQFEAEILAGSATTVVVSPVDFDVNDDGEVNLADLSLVLYNFNSTDAPACDVVEDGLVDVADVVAMVSAIRAENPALLPSAA